MLFRSNIVTNASGATLNLNGGILNVSLNTSQDSNHTDFTNAGTISVTSGTASSPGFKFNFTAAVGNVKKDGSVLYTIINNTGTINNWNTLSYWNFTANGTNIVGATDRISLTTPGKVAFISGFTTLYWNINGGGTWDIDGNTNWRTGDTTGSSIGGWTFKSGTMGTANSGDSVIFNAKYLNGSTITDATAASWIINVSDSDVAVNNQIGRAHV